MTARRTRRNVAIVACLLVLAGRGVAKDHYVAPDGRADAPGTAAKPWDITSALAGKPAIQPGDTIWLSRGTYRCREAYERKGGGFAVKLAGTKDRPIHVRARPGERVTLDGGLIVAAPSSHVWLRDLEITVAPGKAISRETKTSGSHPGDLAAPGGGLNIYSGAGCKFINLVIQDNLGGGIGWWKGATDGEVYGCIIVNNGWKGPDRCHGHCIYAQNQTGTKTVTHCIMTTRWGRGQYAMHAYGSSRAYVDHFVLEGNICYDKGTFLVGGGRPSRGIVVRDNILYKVPMRIGYSAPHNEDCRLAGNVVLDADLTVVRYKQAVVTGNVIAGGAMRFEKCGQVERKDNRVMKRRGEMPPRAVLLPNRYDPKRANLAVLNTRGAKRVAVDVSAFLKPGDAFRLMHAERFFGKPVLEGTCKAATIDVPVDGPFAALVVLKK